MNTYIELKNKEKELLEELKKIEDGNIQLIKEVSELAKCYPEEFRILPKNLDSVNFNKMHNRIEIIKEEIEISNLEESKKQTIYELLELLDKRFVISNQKLKEIEERILENKTAIENREKLIKEKRPMLEDDVRKIASIMKKVNSHYQIIGNEQIEESVKKEAKKAVSNLLEEKNSILEKYEEKMNEFNLKDDLDFIISKEKEEENKQIENENSLSTINSEDVQEVVKKEQAPEKLIGKIKMIGKQGKIRLGLLTTFPARALSYVKKRILKK